MSHLKELLLILLVIALRNCEANPTADQTGEDGSTNLLGKSPSPLDECDSEMIGFELITGYVFSSPNNVIDSIPGTLMLTDCLETCQGNESCQSVNYETGLCVLFESNADLLPGPEALIISKTT
ncbi:hypothetical protein HUJ04_006932 [Dendroctonus ponderosae]|nr:hypothetical protein HUJ04_006932 [Dendroctonus ponderosae]KAH1013193.1 hypothetical protein HUJ05_012215 [Dendroctonus ponderosae]